MIHKEKMLMVMFWEDVRVVTLIEHLNLSKAKGTFTGMVITTLSIMAKR